MKNIARKFSCLALAIFLTWAALVGTAKGEDNTRRATVAKTVNTAFETFKSKNSISFEPKLEQELKRAYLEAILTQDPTKYPNPTAAARSITKYSSEEGIIEILSEWTQATEQKQWEKIFSIDATLGLKIYFDSKDPNIHPYFSENMANKYATLLVKVEPTNLEAKIYLDNHLVCTTRQCKKGVRVASDQSYELKISADGLTDLRQKITLSRQEQRVVNYPPRR